MSGKKITLVAALVKEKTPEMYKRAHCHDMMHPLIYVSRHIIVVNPDQFQRISSQDDEELEKIKQELKDNGIQGTVVLKRALGGTQRARNDSDAEWARKKSRSGMPEVARFEV